MKRTVKLNVIWGWTSQDQLNQHAVLKIHIELSFVDNIILGPEHILGSGCSSTMVLSWSVDGDVRWLTWLLSNKRNSERGLECCSLNSGRHFKLPSTAHIDEPYWHTTQGMNCKQLGVLE